MRGRRPSPRPVSRAIAGCLSGPRPSSPIRTRATPGRRAPDGQKVSRVNVITALPFPPCGHVELVVRGAGGLGRVTRVADDPPVGRDPGLVGAEANRAVEANERGVGLGVRSDLLSDDLDAVGREHEVGVRVRPQGPVDVLQVGRQRVPRPRPGPVDAPHLLDRAVPELRRRDAERVVVHPLAEHDDRAAVRRAVDPVVRLRDVRLDARAEVVLADRRRTPRP